MADSILNPCLGYSDSGRANFVKTEESEKQSLQISPINAASSELAASENRIECTVRRNIAKNVDWDGPSDPSFPHNFPAWRKWTIVSITSSTALCVTCTSSLYTSTYEQLEKEFNCSQIVATLGLSLFIFGLGLGPMLMGPLSEFYGR